MNIKHAVDLFIDKQFLNGNSEKTILYYKINIKYFTDWLGDNVDVFNIDNKILDDYKIYIMQKKAKSNNRTGTDKLSTVTVATYIRAIKVFFRFLVNEGLSTVDIDKFLIPKQKKMQIEILSINEMQKLLNVYNENSATGCRNKAMIAIFLDCGLRRAELINLKIDDVKFEQSIIKVTGKGNKERLIPLGVLSKKLLYKYIYHFRPMEDIETNRVFLNQDSTPITVDTIRSLFSRLKSSSGITRLYPHLLRHTFATYYLINGGDSLTLQIILGHTTLKMVTVYIHLANTIKLFEKNRNSLLDNLYKLKYN